VENSHRTLVWDAPHTLDITDVAPDIQFFIVQENITGSSMDVTETEYSFPNLAVPIGFSISAWNVVGEGETTSISHEPCEISQGMDEHWLLAVCMHLPPFPLAEQQSISAEAVTETVSFEEEGVLSLTFSFRWATNCIPVFSIEIEEESSGTIIASHGTLIPTVSGSGERRTLTLTITSTDLVNDTHYTAHLTSISAQRELEAQGTVPLSKWQDYSAMLCSGATQFVCRFS